MIRSLVGFLFASAVLEVSARLLEPSGFVTSKSVAAVLALLAVIAAELVLYRQRGPLAALLALGWRQPNARVLGITAAVSAALLASMPLVFAATGASFSLPENFLLLALSILLLNGFAEESLYRGYLFRRLRAGRSYRQALVLGIVLAAIAHLPILITAGPIVGLTAVLVSVLTFVPLAGLFEHGENTIWAPALLHFAIDCIIPLGALGMAPPLALLAWLGLSVIASYIALLLVQPRGPAPALDRDVTAAPST